MTVYLGNVQLKAKLYYLYLQVRIYQRLLNDNPDNKDIKMKYERVEEELKEFHNHLSAYD